MAGDVDHVTPPGQGGDPLDPANLRPAHGALSPCPWCGRRCNQVKGDRPEMREPPRSRAW